jgi:hypothetical protein
MNNDEAIRKQAEQWIDAQEHTPDEVQAMLAFMKYRVSPGSFSPPSTLYLRA